MPVSVLRLDMRAPAFSPASSRDLYAAALDIASWADEHDFTAITVSEHHCAEDGFLPAPLTLLALLAGRTQKVTLGTMALLAPLHDPVRLAEEIAVLDIASGGRLMIAAGMGYRPEEYAAAGLDFKRRGKILDETVAKLLQAWSDEPVEHNGVLVNVTPKPFTKPHPMLLIGGRSKAAARRAARFGLPFAPQVMDDELFALYHSECERLGVANGFIAPPGDGVMTIVSRDPEKTWEAMAPYLLYDARIYAEWTGAQDTSVVHSSAETLDELRAGGGFQVLTPEQCLEQAGEKGPGASFVFFPLVAGTPPELAWESLRLYSDEVLPYL